jgi:hypothetical protein
MLFSGFKTLVACREELLHQELEKRKIELNV